MLTETKTMNIFSTFSLNKQFHKALRYGVVCGLHYKPKDSSPDALMRAIAHESVWGKPKRNAKNNSVQIKTIDLNDEE